MGNSFKFTVSPQLKKTDSFLFPKAFHKRGANGSNGSGSMKVVEEPMVEEVPSDVLYLILSFLTPDYITSTVSKVSKEFLYLSYSEVLWKILSTNTFLLFHKKTLDNSPSLPLSTSKIKFCKTIVTRNEFILQFGQSLLKGDKTSITEFLNLETHSSWRIIYKYMLIYFTCFLEDISKEQAISMKLDTLKIIVVGNSNIGKSKFVLRFQDNDYNSTPPVLPINQNRVPKVCSFYNNKFGKSLIQVQIFDDLGYNVHFFENVDCILLCFDVDDEESFTDIKEYWMKQLIEVEKIDTHKAKFVLVGIKRISTVEEQSTSVQSPTIATAAATTTSPTSTTTTFVSYRQQLLLQQQFSNFYKQSQPKKVNRKSVTQFAKMHGMPFFEVESKMNYNVELPFFSLLIQSMHQKFLQQYVCEL